MNELLGAYYYYSVRFPFSGAAARLPKDDVSM